MCIYKGLNKWIQINHQIKSTLKSRKAKNRQISYTLNIIHLQYFILSFLSNVRTQLLSRGELTNLYQKYMYRYTLNTYNDELSCNFVFFQPIPSHYSESLHALVTAILQKTPEDRPRSDFCLPTTLTVYPNFSLVVLNNKTCIIMCT